MPVKVKKKKGGRGGEGRICLVSRRPCGFSRAANKSGALWFARKGRSLLSRLPRAVNTSPIKRRPQHELLTWQRVEGVNMPFSVKSFSCECSVCFSEQLAWRSALFLYCMTACLRSGLYGCHSAGEVFSTGLHVKDTHHADKYAFPRAFAHFVLF